MPILPIVCCSVAQLAFEIVWILFIHYESDNTVDCVFLYTSFSHLFGRWVSLLLWIFPVKIVVLLCAFLPRVSSFVMTLEFRVYMVSRRGVWDSVLKYYNSILSYFQHLILYLCALHQLVVPRSLDGLAVLVASAARGSQVTELSSPRMNIGCCQTVPS